MSRSGRRSSLSRARSARGRPPGAGTVLLAQSQPDQALVLLDRMDGLADSQGRTESLIGTRALRSLAYSTDAKRLGEGRSRCQTRRDADVVPCRPLRHVAVP
jgi:hypothetical protein